MAAILATGSDRVGPFHGPVILILILLVGGGVFLGLRRRRAKRRPGDDRETSSDASHGAPGEGADVTAPGRTARQGCEHLSG